MERGSSSRSVVLPPLDRRGSLGLKHGANTLSRQGSTSIQMGKSLSVSMNAVQKSKPSIEPSALEGSGAIKSHSNTSGIVNAPRLSSNSRRTSLPLLQLKTQQSTREIEAKTEPKQKKQGHSTKKTNQSKGTRRNSIASLTVKPISNNIQGKPRKSRVEKKHIRFETVPIAQFVAHLERSKEIKAQEEEKKARNEGKPRKKSILPENALNLYSPRTRVIARLEFGKPRPRLTEVIARMQERSENEKKKSKIQKKYIRSQPSTPITRHKIQNENASFFRRIWGNIGSFFYQFTREARNEEYIEELLEDLNELAFAAADFLGMGVRELLRIKKVFDKALYATGQVEELDYTELFRILRVRETIFSEALLSLVDHDRSRTLNLSELVLILCAFCVMKKEEVMRFAFDVIDQDASGAINDDEFMFLAKSIHNANPSFPGNFRRALELFDVNNDGLINFSEFVEIHQRFPMLLFPLFRLQDQMQSLFIGSSHSSRINAAYHQTFQVQARQTPKSRLESSAESRYIYHIDTNDSGSEGQSRVNKGIEDLLANPSALNSRAGTLLRSRSRAVSLQTLDISPSQVDQEKNFANMPESTKSSDKTALNYNIQMREIRRQASTSFDANIPTRSADTVNTAESSQKSLNSKTTPVGVHPHAPFPQTNQSPTNANSINQAGETGHRRSSINEFYQDKSKPLSLSKSKARNSTLRRSGTSRMKGSDSVAGR